MVSDSEAGTPQGSPVSPLLANIALHVLDEAWDRRWTATGDAGPLLRRLRRPLPDRERAEAARDLAEETLEPLGLRLHPDKTRIADLRQGAEGFDFLGFHHRMVKSWKRPGRYWLHKWPSPRAMASIRGKVRALTDSESSRTRTGRGGRRSQSRLAGLGRLLPTGQLVGQVRRHRRLRPRAGGKTGQQETRPPRDATGPTASRGTGWGTSGSTDSPERCATRLRMRCDERCRRAVCRRTACTVRSGAAGDSRRLRRRYREAPK